MKAVEMASLLGITESDLRKAILLIRGLRHKAHQQSINPRATRIAILYLEQVDKKFAEKKLSFKEMNKLREIANRLFEETHQRLLG